MRPSVNYGVETQKHSGKTFAERQIQVANGSEDAKITEPGELTSIRKSSPGAKSITLAR